MFPPLGVIRNARKGVFEESQYAAVLKELPEDLKPLVETYYWTGWRSDLLAVSLLPEARTCVLPSPAIAHYWQQSQALARSCAIALCPLVPVGVR
jgi:hypothetical protein